MAKDMSYEMLPGVRVTNACDIPYNNGVRLDTSKFKQLFKNWHENGYPDQQVRDKIGKNKGWAVCSSWTDIPNKKMVFEVLINANKTEFRTVEYADICKEYEWKSFKWSEDGQMILPKK